MRVALVSPYSWTYPGGVTRHIEALAEQLMATGHDVRVLAPYDPEDRFAAFLAEHQLAHVYAEGSASGIKLDEWGAVRYTFREGRIVRVDAAFDRDRDRALGALIENRDDAS